MDTLGDSYILIPQDFGMIRDCLVHPRRGQTPELGPAVEADGTHNPGLVLGMGLGQNTRWNHLFQRLQEPSAAGILARHEVLVATV